ncbi:unnamed protein product [Pleuronectes platessa]|uniref:Uncharacterized protein n=1 Tax=Pleuronectes platessa TaxID=8262 RepID=A0A9N7YCA3_PLEPL|nr:unnamed protein product [Pleuronectes platessa]
MTDRGCHRDSGSKLVPIEVWVDKGWGAEDVLVLIQISFNPSSPSLRPSITHPPPSPIPLPPAPAYILSLHPPITCYPKGVIQAGSLERNGLFFPHIVLFFHRSFPPLPPSFTLCCLIADGSVGQQQQQQQSRSQSVSKR